MIEVAADLAQAAGITAVGPLPQAATDPLGPADDRVRPAERAGDAVDRLILDLFAKGGKTLHHDTFSTPSEALSVLDAPHFERAQWMPSRR